MATDAALAPPELFADALEWVSVQRLRQRDRRCFDRPGVVRMVFIPGGMLPVCLIDSRQCAPVSMRDDQDSVFRVRPASKAAFRARRATSWAREPTPSLR